MTDYVIKIEGLVVGPPTEYDGEYLLSYDPGIGKPGECILDTVRDPQLAKKFPDMVEARKEWMRIDPREPMRFDGKPNRPLTSFSVSFEPVDNGR